MKPIALITGANSGMGKAISIALAKEQYHVIMLCRNESRGKEAHEEVIQKSASQDVDLMLCDLASLSSVRRFAQDFQKSYSNLHILINNAGVITPKRHTTEDGFELQFGVNHLGHFLLTGLLLPLL
ncbi:MAG: SDR family NAD(P)-dependent oxidoreductase, partial [Vallitaleaceae bacterium]|nr:SDR family NAD(P)-dependent oxidoreductase [Vallitaleaceae bacterium]